VFRVWRLAFGASCVIFKHDQIQIYNEIVSYATKIVKFLLLKEHSPKGKKVYFYFLIEMAGAVICN